MNFNNYRMHEEKVLFQSDFAVLPEGINIHQPQSIILDDEELHFTAPEGEGLGAEIPVFYTDPVHISFRLKLGKDINRPHPLSHINLFTNGAKRFCINFDTQSIGSFYQLSQDEWGEGFHSNSKLARNQWYVIDILVKESKIAIFINGKRRISTTLPADVNKTGGLRFECHNEMWVDDVMISSIQGFEIVDPD